MVAALDGSALVYVGATSCLMDIPLLEQEGVDWLSHRDSGFAGSLLVRFKIRLLLFELAVPHKGSELRRFV